MRFHADGVLGLGTGGKSLGQRKEESSVGRAKEEWEAGKARASARMWMGFVDGVLAAEHRGQLRS